MSSAAKGFVVTSDYVGPDRRKDVSRPSNVELFDPPNSLKMKAKDRLSAEETAQRLDAELKGARELLNSEKLRRDAFQICILWRMMQEEIPGARHLQAGSGEDRRSGARCGATLRRLELGEGRGMVRLDRRRCRGSGSRRRPQRLDASSWACSAEPEPRLPPREIGLRRHSARRSTPPWPSSVRAR